MTYMAIGCLKITTPLKIFLRRPEKTKILDEIQKITQVDRKHLIKLLRGKRPLYNEAKQGRPTVYSDKV